MVLLSKTSQLSYLLILFLGIVLTGLFWKEVPLPQILGINLNLLIYYLTHNFSHRQNHLLKNQSLFFLRIPFRNTNEQLYSLKDGFVYVKNYVLDSRPIVAFERVKEIEEFSFKR
jgi:hypothetical protein